MAQTITADVVGREVQPLTIAFAAGLNEVTENQVALYIADGVSYHRTVELVNGFVWLYNGLRDRDIFYKFAAGPVYTVVNVDFIGEPNRRTASDIAALAVVNGDFGIGIGSGVATNSGARLIGPTLMCGNGIGQVVDYFRENIVALRAAA